MVPYTAVVATYALTIPCDRMFTQSTWIYTMLFFLGPGFSSMSPDSMSMSNSVEWFVLALTGNVIGLRPADVHLLLSRLVSM